MKTLPLRIVSAAAIIVILGLVYFLAHELGLVILSSIICMVGSYEYYRMFISPLSVPPSLKAVFLICCFSTTLTAVIFNDTFLWAIALYSLYFIFFGLWSLHKTTKNEQILEVVQIGNLGIFYSGLLPAFAIKLLLLDLGLIWFFLLLTIVFSGDIFAYFGGILLGRTKIMPTVSPNKTLAGSVVGLFGSVVASIVFAKYLLPTVSIPQMALYSVIAGVLAQSGDFFESLLKRVVNQKDSGQIMPGHGGVLDRLDGVYFAAPLIYAMATLPGHS